MLMEGAVHFHAVTSVAGRSHSQSDLSPENALQCSSSPPHSCNIGQARHQSKQKEGVNTTFKANGAFIIKCFGLYWPLSCKWRGAQHFMRSLLPLDAPSLRVIYHSENALLSSVPPHCRNIGRARHQSKHKEGDNTTRPLWNGIGKALSQTSSCS